MDQVQNPQREDRDRAWNIRATKKILDSCVSGARLAYMYTGSGFVFVVSGRSCGA
jgi:hypothetical protein